MHKGIRPLQFQAHFFIFHKFIPFMSVLFIHQWTRASTDRWDIFLHFSYFFTHADFLLVVNQSLPLFCSYTPLRWRKSTSFTSRNTIFLESYMFLFLSVSSFFWDYFTSFLFFFTLITIIQLNKFLFLSLSLFFPLLFPLFSIFFLF